MEGLVRLAELYWADEVRFVVVQQAPVSPQTLLKSLAKSPNLEVCASSGTAEIKQI